MMTTISTHASQPLTGGHEKPHHANQDEKIRTLLTQAGLTSPITLIKPSAIPGISSLTLASGQKLLAQLKVDSLYLILADIEANPSPAVAIPPDMRAPLPIGSPVTAAHHAALLANMRALPMISSASLFYHTGMTGVLQAVAAPNELQFLVSDDGRYLIDGGATGSVGVIREGKLHEIDEVFMAAKRAQILAKLPDSQLAIYPAIGVSRATVYIATDMHCKYCRVFHERISEYNTQGITVKAIGYPVYDESVAPMQSIWCEPDPQRRATVLTAAMKGIISRTTCQADGADSGSLARLVNQAHALDIFATPAIYRSDGTLFTGDLGGDDLYRLIGIR